MNSRDRNQKEPRLELRQTAAASVRKGHPWVYREGIVRAPTLASGTTVRLVDETGKPLAVGLWDESSPISVRVFGLGALQGRVDARLLVERIERALLRRQGLFGQETNAYRLCNGEGDHVPGLVIDKYDFVAVLRTDGEHLVPLLDALIPKLERPLGAHGIRSIVLRKSRDEEGERRFDVVAGQTPPDRLLVRENNMVMEVDLARGQKTGAFLDQRDNRARIRSLVKEGSKVLNLYSYAGGFSVAAALGGASHVTSVDSAAAAHATAQRSFRENGIDPAAHAFVTADVFAFLEAAERRKDSFDLIISDPPSFAPNERAKARALVAYRKLHGALVRVLSKGGTLAAASCSSHISMEDFLTTLDAAALGREDLSMIGAFGESPDHPTLPAWPEGRYLKLVLVR